MHGYQTIVNDEILMKTALSKIGPLIVNLNANCLYDYIPGTIFDDPTGTYPPLVNHNALAVGYGTDPATGLDYYIVKNSWGNAWGKLTFYLIAN